MPRLQVISTERTMCAFNNLINYIARPDRCINRYFGAVNLYIDDHVHPEPSIRDQIFRVIEMHQAGHKKLTTHLIMTFDDNERQHLTADYLLRLAYDFCLRMLSNCMVYFAIHDNTPKLHIHFMIVPLDIYNGKTWSSGKCGWYLLGNEATRLLEQYIPKDEVDNVHVTYGKTPRKAKKRT